MYKTSHLSVGCPLVFFRVQQYYVWLYIDHIGFHSNKYHREIELLVLPAGKRYTIHITKFFVLDIKRNISTVFVR